MRVNKMLRKVRAIAGRNNFDNSTAYWEKRYRTGGDSGAGSYNRLAEFKAKVINEFVEVNDIKSVIEFGSGDGAQLELADYPEYTGVDVSETVIASTRQRFASNPTVRFMHLSEVTDRNQAELALSLDVIYHLVEDVVFDDYMHRLFNSATRFVIVYSSNEDQKITSPHVRHRHFTRWVEKSVGRQFFLAERIANPFPFSENDPANTSFADFYIFRRHN